MRKIIQSTLLLGCAAFANAASAPCATSAPDFEAPAGWTRTDIPTPTPNRTIARWQIAGDTATSITFIADSSVSYAETMAAINKNFSDNGIRPTINRDVPCQSTKAHVVEFDAGPDGMRTIFNRLVVPIGSGVATITYTRIEGNVFEDDIRKAEDAFCAQTPAVPADPGVAPSAAPSNPSAPSPAAT